MTPFPVEPLFGTPAAVALAVAHLEEKTMHGHQHNYLPEVDGNGLKTGVVGCDCGAWESGYEDEGTYVDGNRITDMLTVCDACGDESNSAPGLTCGRMIFERDSDEGGSLYCRGTYRTRAWLAAQRERMAARMAEMDAYTR